MKQTLKILPLGGLGEIGLNIMVIQYGDDAIVVDCGVMFADAHLPGIDLVIPDFSYLMEGKIRLKAVLLTHGHEDHIGALPYLLREVNAPVYGSKFTLALVKERLKEHSLGTEVDLRTAKEGDRFHLGPFHVEFIRMSHSIADAMALAIETPEGKIIHTGDFKIDPKPADGRTTDLARFEALGKEGVFLLFSDSTNVEIPGESVSESSVYAGLEEVVRKAPGWIILASFASHVPRISQVIQLAQAEGRKVHVAGRSMVQNVGIARDLGYLTIPEGLLVDVDEALRLPRKKLMILSTGTQGEPQAVLARMAFDQHRDLKVIPGDRVILSSRFIPGNERAIYAIVNHLYRRGAEVFTTKGAEVHVSGHAYRGDLEKVLRLVKPRFFIPVHGEYRHLVKHIELARETGVDENRAILVEDGDLVEFRNGEARIIQRLDLSRSVVDGHEMADIESTAIRDRRQLSETGIVIAVVIVNRRTGDIVRGPEIFSRGLLIGEGSDEVMEEVAAVVKKTLKGFNAEARTDEFVVEEEIRLCIRRYFKSRLSRKPVVIPIVMEV